MVWNHWEKSGIIELRIIGKWKYKNHNTSIAVTYGTWSGIIGRSEIGKWKYKNHYFTTHC